jgi:hypothetical protein
VRPIARRMVTGPRSCHVSRFRLVRMSTDHSLAKGRARCGRKNYAEDELAHGKAAVDRQLTAYRALPPGLSSNGRGWARVRAEPAPRPPRARRRRGVLRSCPRRVRRTRALPLIRRLDDTATPSTARRSANATAPIGSQRLTQSIHALLHRHVGTPCTPSALGVCSSVHEPVHAEPRLSAVSGRPGCRSGWVGGSGPGHPGGEAGEQP